MIQRNSLPGVLVLLGIALLVTPALFPVQPVLSHDTRLGTMHSEAQLEEQGYEVIAYENLSERGQELYVRTLEHDGRYSVPVTEGAPDFRYPTRGELYSSNRGGPARHGVVIKRPADADLPPADEPVGAPERGPERTEERETEEGPSAEERRQRVAQYDLMRTLTETPPLTATPNLVRLLAAIAGVIAIGTGGYHWSKP